MPCRGKTTRGRFLRHPVVRRNVHPDSDPAGRRRGKFDGRTDSAGGRNPFSHTSASMKKFPTSLPQEHLPENQFCRKPFRVRSRMKREWSPASVPASGDFCCQEENASASILMNQPGFHFCQGGIGRPCRYLSAGEEWQDCWKKKNPAVIFSWSPAGRKNFSSGKLLRVDRPQ